MQKRIAILATLAAAFFAAVSLAQIDNTPLPTWTTPIVAALEINPNGMETGLAQIRTAAELGNIPNVTTRQVDMFTSAVLQVAPPRRREKVDDYVRRIVAIIDGPLGEEHPVQRSAIVNRMITGAKNMVGNEANRLSVIAAGSYTYSAP